LQAYFSRWKLEIHSKYGYSGEREKNKMRRQKKTIGVLILALFVSFTFINIFSRCTCDLVQPVKSPHPCCQAEGKDCCKTQKCRHISSDLAINKQEILGNSCYKKISHSCLFSVSIPSISTLTKQLIKTNKYYC